MANLGDIIQRGKYSYRDYQRYKDDYDQRNKALMVAMILKGIGTVAQGAKSIHDSMLSAESAARAKETYEYRKGRRGIQEQREQADAERAAQRHAWWQQQTGAPTTILPNIKAGKEIEDINKRATPEGAAEDLGKKLLALTTAAEESGQPIPPKQLLKGAVARHSLGDDAYAWADKDLPPQVLTNRAWLFIDSMGFGENSQQMKMFRTAAVQALMESGLTTDQWNSEDFGRLIAKHPQKYFYLGALTDTKGKVNKDEIDATVTDILGLKIPPRLLTQTARGSPERKAATGSFVDAAIRTQEDVLSLQGKTPEEIEWQTKAQVEGISNALMTVNPIAGAAMKAAGKKISLDSKLDGELAQRVNAGLKMGMTFPEFTYKPKQKSLLSKQGEDFLGLDLTERGQSRTVPAYYKAFDMRFPVKDYDKALNYFNTKLDEKFSREALIEYLEGQLREVQGQAYNLPAF
jgi:hypothetical protein